MTEASKSCFEKVKAWLAKSGAYRAFQRHAGWCTLVYTGNWNLGHVSWDDSCLHHVLQQRRFSLSGPEHEWTNEAGLQGDLGQVHCKI